MTDDDNSLGGRLPLLEPAAMTQQQRTYYDAVIANQPPGSTQEPEAEGYAIQDGNGRLIGPFNSFLRRPEVASTFVAFAEAAARHTSLSARVREIVILSTCSAWGAAYPLYAHERTARQAGLPQAVINEIVNGNTPDVLSEQEQTAARVTQHLVTEHTIDNTLYERALHQFGEQGLFDIVALIGQYLTASAITNLFSVPAPETRPGETGRCTPRRQELVPETTTRHPGPSQPRPSAAWSLRSTPGWHPQPPIPSPRRRLRADPGPDQR